MPVFFKSYRPLLWLLWPPGTALGEGPGTWLSGCPGAWVGLFGGSGCGQFAGLAVGLPGNSAISPSDEPTSRHAGGWQYTLMNNYELVR